MVGIGCEVMPSIKTNPLESETRSFTGILYIPTCTLLTAKSLPHLCPHTLDVSGSPPRQHALTPQQHVTQGHVPTLVVHCVAKLV